MVHSSAAFHSLRFSTDQHLPLLPVHIRFLILHPYILEWYLITFEQSDEICLLISLLFKKKVTLRIKKVL